MSYGDNPQAFRMDATGALSLAIERARFMLFRPFDLAKWLSLGLIILLDVLVSGGGTSNFNFPSGDLSAFEWGRQDWARIWPVVVGIGGVIVAVVLVIGVVLTWLSSRGQLMFTRAVALDDVSIGDNWRASGSRGFSLFLFRLAFAFVGLLLVLLLVAAAVAAVAVAGDAFPTAALVILALVIAVPVVVALIIVQVLLRAFVVPIMWRYDLPAMQAWRVFLSILRINKAPVLLFLVIRLAYATVFGITAMLVGCLTCCLGFLPYIHHVLFAPYYVFDRAYSLYMLESLGPDYQMVATPPWASAPVGEAPMPASDLDTAEPALDEPDEYDESDLSPEDGEGGEPSF